MTAASAPVSPARSQGPIERGFALLEAVRQPSTETASGSAVATSAHPESAVSAVARGVRDGVYRLPAVAS